MQLFLSQAPMELQENCAGACIGEKYFAGPLLKELRQYYPEAPVYDRSCMNLWEDDKAGEAVIATGSSRLKIGRITFFA